MKTVHKLRKPVESRRALQARQKTLALGVALALGIAGALLMLLIGCGGGSSASVLCRQSLRPCKRCKSLTYKIL